jgi:hypothetical protein
MTDTTENSLCSMHEALVSYLYEEATPEDVRLMESHLKGCSACAEELQAFEGVRRMLGHWKIEDVPIVRVMPQAGRRPRLAALREIFVIAPMWAKAATAALAALLVLSVMGTEIAVGPGGFTFRTNLFRSSSSVSSGLPVEPAVSAPVQATLTKEEVEQIVNKEIVAREKEQKQELSAELAAMEEQVRRTHSSDVTKLAVRLEEQRDHIKVLESDIDRREGLDVADILFSSGGRTGGSESGAPEGGR